MSGTLHRSTLPETMPFIFSQGQRVCPSLSISKRGNGASFGMDGSTPMIDFQSREPSFNSAKSALFAEIISWFIPSKVPLVHGVYPLSE